MRVLHVACMPFPSPQGTQAAVRSMLDASAAAGHDAHALVYGFGTDAPPGGAILHRIPAGPRVRRSDSLRSGPSMTKIALDLRIVEASRRLSKALDPDLVVAHHVEAAIAIGAARLRAPTCVIAHAVLGTELETYLPRALAPLARRIGRSLDRRAIHAADTALAVTPSVATALASSTRRPVGAIATPWSASGTKEARTTARAALALPSDARVVLYAGNLDGYQRWEVALQAIAQPALRGEDVRLLVATESAREDLLRYAYRLGVRARVHVAPLADEADRARAHGAADVAFVPRGTSPGLPIKLLDALARGTPVVATRRAAAGLPLDGAAVVVPDDDPAEAAAAFAALASDPAVIATRVAAGRDYLRREHAADRYVRALEALGRRHIA